MPADKNPTPLAVDARAVPPRALQSTYPEPYFSRMAGREKRALGDLFGLKVFGVNLTRLKPGGESALLHRHTRQDEFIFIVEGEPTLITEAGSMALKPACGPRKRGCSPPRGRSKRPAPSSVPRKPVGVKRRREARWRSRPSSA